MIEERSDPQTPLESSKPVDICLHLTLEQAQRILLLLELDWEAWGYLESRQHSELPELARITKTALEVLKLAVEGKRHADT